MGVSVRGRCGGDALQVRALGAGGQQLRIPAGGGQVRWNRCPRRALRGRSWQAGGARARAARVPVQRWRPRLGCCICARASWVSGLLCTSPAPSRRCSVEASARWTAALLRCPGRPALGRGQPGFVPNGPALCLRRLRPQVSGTVFLNTSGAPGKVPAKVSLRPGPCWNKAITVMRRGLQGQV